MSSSQSSIIITRTVHKNWFKYWESTFIAQTVCAIGKSTKASKVGLPAIHGWSQVPCCRRAPGTDKKTAFLPDVWWLYELVSKSKGDVCWTSLMLVYLWVCVWCNVDFYVNVNSKFIDVDSYNNLSKLWIPIRETIMCHFIQINSLHTNLSFFIFLLHSNLLNPYSEPIYWINILNPFYILFQSVYKMKSAQMGKELRAQ